MNYSVNEGRCRGIFQHWSDSEKQSLAIKRGKEIENNVLNNRPDPCHRDGSQVASEITRYRLISIFSHLSLSHHRGYKLWLVKTLSFVIVNEFPQSKLPVHTTKNVYNIFREAAQRNHEVSLKFYRKLDYSESSDVTTTF